MKLYYANVDRRIIDAEKARAKAAFVLGIPTVISFEVVECDGRIGVVYELIASDMLCERIEKDPDHLERYVDGFCSLAKSIHSTTVNGDEPFGSVKTSWKDMLAEADYLSVCERAACLHVIDLVPDTMTLLHGDLHTKNVMMAGDEPLLIDMADMKHGHPIFDLAGMYLTYILPGPDQTPQRVGLTKDIAVAFYELFLKKYLETTDEDEIEAIKKRIENLAKVKLLLAPVISPTLRTDAFMQRFDMLKRSSIPQLEAADGVHDLTVHGKMG